MRSGLIARLRERGVLRVAASYAVIAWLALQIADVVLEPWALPDWVRRAPLVVALVGFPIALALAWFLELGDGAVTRDRAVDGVARPVAHGWRRHIDIAVISVLGAIVGFFVMRDAGWLGETARPGRGIEASSLAVLPFTGVGAYGDQHVSEGLSDELRNQFSRMQSLRVTARSSSIAFKDQSLDAVAMASRLAVAVLLEGTVGRSGGRLQVSVQLVDGRDGKVMWAERYDRPDDDLLTVQTEIANSVVAAVLPRFAASGQAAPAPPTDDPVAYDLYLLARQKLREADALGVSGNDSEAQTANAQAIDLFSSAIAADTEFAQAYASRAGARLTSALDRIDEASREAQAAAVDREVMPDIERALALDPRNADAYFYKGRLLRNTHRAGAGDAYRRAVELDPSHAAATLSLALVAVGEGRVDEQHRLVMRARDLDPMDPQTHEGAMISAWVLGRVAEQQAIVERMTSLFPDNAAMSLSACWSWMQRGRPDETLACIAAARDRFDKSPSIAREADGTEVQAWESLGEEARAQRVAERGRSDDSDYRAQALQRRGDVAGLRRMAEQALARRLTIFDVGIVDSLARAGLRREAIAIYRKAGMADIMVSDTWFKVIVLPDFLLLVTHDSPFSAAGLDNDLVFARLADDPRFKAQLERLHERQEQIRAQLPGTFRRHGLAWPPK